MVQTEDEQVFHSRKRRAADCGRIPASSRSIAHGSHVDQSSMNCGHDGDGDQDEGRDDKDPRKKDDLPGRAIRCLGIGLKCGRQSLDFLRGVTGREWQNILLFVRHAAQRVWAAPPPGGRGLL